MNEDITALRIFDDHLSELSLKAKDAITKTFVSDSKTQFADYRKEIDELKHEMHLQKMNLAALVRDDGSTTTQQASNEDHEALKKRYYEFREKFDNAKKTFVDLGE